MTEYASLSKNLSKNVQVVIQVVKNKKVMANLKTPREANLYGNWCVRKGLNYCSVPSPSKSEVRSNKMRKLPIRANTFFATSLSGGQDGSI